MIVQPPTRSLKVLVLGLAKSGKSAVTVRYLTKRYIGEYSSCKDFLYHHCLTFDGEAKTELEIMDTLGSKSGQQLYDQIAWADAFVVVYSITDVASFRHARYLLETISVLKGPQRSPVILLGNKRDLEHARQVPVDEGQETSLQWQCQFYEVSAAESFVGVSLAFQGLIRESRPLLAIKAVTPVRRKTSPAMAVSKMIGLVFGKSTTGKNQRPWKKRPSLSI